MMHKAILLYRAVFRDGAAFRDDATLRNDATSRNGAHVNPTAPLTAAVSLRRIECHNVPRELVSLAMCILVLLFLVPQRSTAQTYGFRATYENNGASDQYYFRLWTPPEVEHIKGVVLLWAGAGQDWRERVDWEYNQNAARALGFALIGTRDNDAGLSNEEVDDAFQQILSEAASISGHPELENAPVALMGFSAGGFKMTRSAALSSGRVIGFVGHKGAQIVQLSSDGVQVPALFIAGEFDSSFTPDFVRQAFQDWRNQGGLAANAIDWNVGHSDNGNQGWEAGWYWIAESIRARYPPEALPSVIPGNVMVLDSIALESGWLGDKARFNTSGNPVITDPFIEVSPYAEYSGSKSAASWLPNEGAAYMYRAFTSTDLQPRIDSPFQTPISILHPAPFDTIRVGSSLGIEIDTRGFSDEDATHNVVVYDGADSLGNAAFGQPFSRWSMPYTADSVGVHALSVIVTDTLGNRRTSFRTFVVLPEVTNTAIDGPVIKDPPSFVLEPAYPNPFDQTATIGLDVSRTAYFQVAVYDVLGRVVQTLVDHTLAPGLHSVQFDRQGLADGLYLIRASATENLSATMKRGASASASTNTLAIAWSNTSASASSKTSASASSKASSRVPTLVQTQTLVLTR